MVKRRGGVAVVIVKCGVEVEEGLVGCAKKRIGALLNPALAKTRR